MLDLLASRDFIAAAKLIALARDASGVGTSARPWIERANTVFFKISVYVLTLKTSVHLQYFFSLQ